MTFLVHTIWLLCLVVLCSAQVPFSGGPILFGAPRFTGFRPFGFRGFSFAPVFPRPDFRFPFRPSFPPVRPPIFGPSFAGPVSDFAGRTFSNFPARSSLTTGSPRGGRSQIVTSSSSTSSERAVTPRTSTGSSSGRGTTTSSGVQSPITHISQLPPATLMDIPGHLLEDNWGGAGPGEAHSHGQSTPIGAGRMHFLDGTSAPLSEEGTIGATVADGSFPGGSIPPRSTF